MSKLGWLWLAETNSNTLDAYTLSVPEILSKQGYALLLNRNENDDFLAAELCVHALLNKTEKPNILFISPGNIIKKRYSLLLWDMGVEFKNLSVEYFNEAMSNLCLASSDGDDLGKTAVLNSDFVWDLMIIDFPFGCEVNISKYVNNIKTKTRALLINAQVSKDFGQTCENLSQLVKNLLIRDGKKKKDADFSAEELSGTIIAGRSMHENYNIKIISYALKADKNKALITELKKITSNEENKVVIYCNNDASVKVLKKELRLQFKTCVYDSDTGMEFISSYLKDKTKPEPQVIITDDNSGVKFINIPKVTHIINYEYPDNPVVLEQRLTRPARKGFMNPVFMLFCDKDCKLDGKILRHNIFANIGGMFCGQIPDKCLLFDIPEAEEHLIVLILDLKHIADTKNDKNAKETLEKLLAMFELDYVLKQRNVDGERLYGEIMNIVARFKGKRIYLDENRVIRAAEDLKLPEKKSIDTKEALEFIKKPDKKLIKELKENLKLAALFNLYKYAKEPSYKAYIENMKEVI